MHVELSRISIPSVGRFFFSKPTNFDEKGLRKKWNDESKSILAAFTKEINEKSPTSEEDYREILGSSAESIGLNPGKAMQALRLAVTGKGQGADLMSTLSILGVKEVSDRINWALENL